MLVRLKSHSTLLMATVLILTVGVLGYLHFSGGEVSPYDDLVDVPVVNAKAEIVLEGPKEVKVGQLARIDVTKSAGRTFKWSVLPVGVDYEVYNDGRKLIFSSGTPGTYTFIVSCANENDVDHKVIEIAVVSGYVPPAPGPSPGPDPGTGLAGKVVEWCNLVQSPNRNAEAGALAQNFSLVAGQIESGKLRRADAIIKATQKANRHALGRSLPQWVPFLEKLQRQMKDDALAGLLVTPAHHATMWRQISEGLTIVSK